MTATIKPALKRAFARDRWYWIPAATMGAPTVAQVNAGAGFNLSCSVFGDTQEGPSVSVDKTTLPRLNCETETFEVNGATKVSAPDLVVSFDPQSDAGSDGKKAWEAMDDNADGFLVRGQDLDPNVAAVVAGDFVDLIPAQLGVKVPTKTSNDPSGVYAFNVGVSVTGSPDWNVAVVA